MRNENAVKVTQIPMSDIPGVRAAKCIERKPMRFWKRLMLAGGFLAYGDKADGQILHRS